MAMPMIIVRHKVKDYAAWKKVFDADKPNQTAAGLSNARLFRSDGDASEVVILMDAASVDKAKMFAASPDLKAAMQSAGVVDQPTVFLLNEAK
jgi:hypothetical protein